MVLPAGLTGAQNEDSPACNVTSAQPDTHTKVYETSIRARLGTTARFCKAIKLVLAAGLTGAQNEDTPAFNVTSAHPDMLLGAESGKPHGAPCTPTPKFDPQHFEFS